ncbi:hypothetical protein FTO68_06220 [Methanocalculus taiwanensis]|uniref:DUF2769 domain-containing protein n=1 Tax=Methanocalculus taiwanensis TaxID=106207 RepID=A0ABD4TMR9_9EURY|nr:hypothetical protein [Methanocalculus taiwanensis]MCQ1538580.1 hypothetical protein [Methanocalculus taiwanensis]
MSLKVDQAWADEYLKKKNRDPPVLPESCACADLRVPDMREGDPCRRCGSGLPGYRRSICPAGEGDPSDGLLLLYVCEECEKKTVKRIMRRGRGDE